jgi:hypothetical protein
MGKFLGIPSLLQGILRKSETFAGKLTATHLLCNHCVGLHHWLIGFVDLNHVVQ